MAHMKPVADHFVAYIVETDHGTEIIPESLCGTIDLSGTELLDEDAQSILEFTEGSRIRSVDDVERKEGWYSRLSAPGYLDCTAWQGPYATEAEALAAVQEAFDVDANGDDADDTIG
jgi:hypothetical protein